MDFKPAALLREDLSKFTIVLLRQYASMKEELALLHAHLDYIRLQCLCDWLINSGLVRLVVQWGFFEIILVFEKIFYLDQALALLECFIKFGFEIAMIANNVGLLNGVHILGLNGHQIVVVL